MNRALKLVSSLVFLAVAACGPGNSEVTLEGNTLKPKSAEFWSGPISTEFPIPFTMVMVHDIDGLCETFGSADPCSGSIDPTRLTSADATMLTIAKIGEGEGESTVGSGGFAGAMLQFVAIRGGRQVVVDEAVSGTITFDDFDEGSGTYGSYEVVMKSGAKLEGTFDADFCDGLDKMIKMGSTRAQCDGNADSSNLQCSNSCSCGGKTNSVSCSRAESNADWTCTCNSGGTTSTCTVSKDAFSACESPSNGGQGCCPDPEDF